jgi:NAD+ diphosphatase
MRYCPRCGGPLETQSIAGRARRACRSPECGFVHWDNPVPVVAALVQHGDRFVLARHRAWPEDVYSVITGFLERDETPEQAAARETREELGLEAASCHPLGHFSLLERNQLILAFWVEAHGRLALGEEIVDTRLVARAELEHWRFGDLALTAAIVRRWAQLAASASP